MPRASRPFRLVLAALFIGAIGVGAFLARRATPERKAMTMRDESIARPAPKLGGAVPAPRFPLVAASAKPTFSPNALFAYATPPNAAQLDAALPAPARAIDYVRLNAALIAGKRSPFWKKSGEGRVELPLPDGGVLAVVIDESTMLGADRFTSTGHVEGRLLSRAVFAWNQGFLHASIDDAELGSFALRAATEEFTQFYRIDPTLVGTCGGERRPLADAATLSAAAARQARAAELAPSNSLRTPADVPPSANPQHAEVHVMMAYTQSVLATLSGAIRTAALQSAFDAAIAKVNSDLAASAVTARVKLVAIAETHYDENAAPSGVVQDNALTALFQTTDGQMDELHALRDQSGADLVCLALNRSDFASTGLAFVLDTPGNNLNPLFAFSVVQYSAIAGTSLVSHELGHSFGCAHDREHSASHGAYGYSYGYRFTASNGRQYHDIMSYDPGTGLSYFSNPTLNAPAPAPANSPGGIAPGLPGESDTALTIEQEAFEVATYRLQTPAVANAGTLLNVSTQAYVGTGEQALIGGFMITGPAPKKILIRAAGPALAAFRLATSVLADPVLELYSGPAVIQSNDNWAAPTNGATAADVTTAAEQAGAFPFLNGSADAALLVTLAPGAYTAVVHGVGGRTGFALVECYEVGAVSGRVVSLAGRGYADNTGRPLVGGFVISGAPGSTKRILIRVRGPSLVRDFGIASGLNDPFMELHNAAGDLIMKNDDWSSGTVAGTASAVNDFKPLVRFYNEQKIAATGLAPSNRRESCVLVELPPGDYTVVAKPFEQRDPDPDLDEPAAPGVGLVEVFEINP